MGDHQADPLYQSSAWCCKGGGRMPKNNQKISEMEKIRNLDETGREAWYENEA